MATAKMIFYLKKLVLLSIMCIGLVANQACQLRPTKETQFQQDQIRTKHAHELLEKSYKTSVVKKFEGDFMLSEYIKKYIQKENIKINADDLTETLMKVSQKHGYDPIFLLAVIKTESQFNPNAIGSAGEIGLMQIKPDTAEWICRKNKLPWNGAESLKNPHYNVLIGGYYFEYLKKTLRSQSARYINAYNMGINSLQRLPAQAQNQHPYFEKVIANYLYIYSELKKIRG